jgi:DNA-binding NarL/FixJ family response regulator
MENIRVLIFEDNDDFRQGLVQLLNFSEGYDLIQAYSDANDSLNAVAIHQPDVILMDIDMPGMSGTDAVRRIKKAYPQAEIIMITVFENEEHVFEAIKAGANGYLLKKSSPVKILEAIKEAKEGGAPMSASIARKVIAFFSQQNKVKSADYDLSNREKEVLKSLVAGNSYKMIAAELSISVETVRSHIKKIYEKLHVNSNTEAVAKALREGLS